MVEPGAARQGGSAHDHAPRTHGPGHGPGPSAAIVIQLTFKRGPRTPPPLAPPCQQSRRSAHALGWVAAAPRLAATAARPSGRRARAPDPQPPRARAPARPRPAHLAASSPLPSGSRKRAAPELDTCGVGGRGPPLRRALAAGDRATARPGRDGAAMRPAQIQSIPAPTSRRAVRSSARGRAWAPILVRCPRLAALHEVVLGHSGHRVPELRCTAVTGPNEGRARRGRTRRLLGPRGRWACGRGGGW